ncbi:DegT/DnrJ/EryC1/StrS aminotransferase family protein [Pseudoalteromonas sp. SG41-6]|uniref:DegT/DnrJ/EryC1/StrS family aminotransferase n=1 Tax=Pseudoalteromonas sp. SG41-6 TaxID=2760974 RepID=UPI0015FF5FB5|nr:DegT/DnrJ/EryC1/StrS family aminotransferase [Pseudoalteromonas sp. SG41-6]MBB1448375.1 DegT/DnrJ/EryC1/StrS family aminotransferase [Pseudoalteromonas sp. SG41-6]
MKYPIVKPFLPPLNNYPAHIASVFERNWLTNNGPCLQKLEQQLAEYFNVEHLLLVANGTLALQVAFAALNIDTNKSACVLTTPFSFAATASSLCFANLTPEFIDIDPATYNIDITKASEAQLNNATAILGVHVFGNPCDVAGIERAAKQHNLKVIYDAAHAFASDIKNTGNDMAITSVLHKGDAATLSLHATKLFHSVEGGAIIFKHKADYLKAKQLINFGFDAQQYPEFVGINAKMSEVHAAMGLSVFEHLDHITSWRQQLSKRYTERLKAINTVQLQVWHCDGNNNGAYMPVVFESQTLLLKVQAALTEVGVQTRRYFYPSLSQVPAYGMRGDTPLANSLSERILCLPMFTDLTLDGVDEICDHLMTVLNDCA